MYDKIKKFFKEETSIERYTKLKEKLEKKAKKLKDKTDKDSITESHIIKKLIHKIDKKISQKG